MQICPVDRQWVYHHLLTPYLQGCALIARAWEGKDDCIVANRLNFKERAIYWIQGTALMLPFINTIVWLAWQTLSPQEKLFDLFSYEEPETKAAPLLTKFQPPSSIIHPLIEEIKKAEIFEYEEETDTMILENKWTVKHYPDLTIAHLENKQYSSTYIYNPDMSLKEYNLNYLSPSKHLKIFQNPQNKTQLHVEISDSNGLFRKTLQLKEGLPWIQQRTLGFRPFLKSKAQTLDFWAVIPEVPLFENLPYPLKAIVSSPPFLVKMRAQKKREEEVAGHGKLLKIEVQPVFPLPKLPKTELWFDLSTGVLKKFIDHPPFIPKKLGEIRNHPLPGSTRR